MRRVLPDDELLAFEKALPPIQDRPPPSVVVGKDHPAFVVHGTPFSEAASELRSLGYRVSQQRAPLDGTDTIPPYSARVQTYRCAKTSESRVAAAAVCRKLTEDERNLIEAYYWLPRRVLKEYYPRIDSTLAADMLSAEGQPYLCHSAVKFDGRCRFGTYVRAVLRGRYARTYRVHKTQRDATVSLDVVLSETGRELAPDRRPSPDTSFEAVNRAFELHAPYTTGRERAILTAHYGLDGDAPLSFPAIGEPLELTAARIQQIASRALFSARAYKRDAAGPRGDQT